MDRARMRSSFDDLVSGAASADVSGWGFEWLDGRATEQRPSWGYQRLISERLPTVGAAVDLQTGGGEVLSGVRRFPLAMVATEGWPANVALATSRLHPRGVIVVAHDGRSALPFADGAFDLVISRHPVAPCWTQIARVLRPGGGYLGQHVGPDSVGELSEFFLGPQEPTGSRHSRHPDWERADAEAAGLTVTAMRMERLRMEFFDVGAVVYFLRKVIWIVPGFEVDKYIRELQELHDRIERAGVFVAHSTRVLVMAERPVSRIPS